MKIVYKKEISGITSDEKDSAEIVLNEYGTRLEKKLGDEIEIEIHVKNYGKIKTNEYEVSLRVSGLGTKNSSKHFFESNATERDFVRAVHSALKKLNAEIEHKLHVSDQGRR